MEAQTTWKANVTTAQTPSALFSSLWNCWPSSCRDTTVAANFDDLLTLRKPHTKGSSFTSIVVSSRGKIQQAISHFSINLRAVYEVNWKEYSNWTVNSECPGFSLWNTTCKGLRKENNSSLYHTNNFTATETAMDMCFEPDLLREGTYKAKCIESEYFLHCIGGCVFYLP